MPKWTALLLLPALTGCSHWEESVTLQDSGGGAWHLSWSALERGITGEGHLDSGHASWICRPLPEGGGWSVEAPSAHWFGSRLPKNSGTTWTGSVRVKGAVLSVDLKDAKGRGFEGNGDYPLINRTPTHAYGRR